MAIPQFDSNSVLPPHLGNPTELSQVSPYPCTSLEICERFGPISETRRRILRGFLELRTLLAKAGFSGFQWLDGSFLEDIEGREQRGPNDIDVVTFFHSPPGFSAQVAREHPLLLDRRKMKLDFSVDHFFVPLTYNPTALVESVRYWSGLFSHRRDGVWKGMLRLELGTVDDDRAAKEHLEALA